MKKQIAIIGSMLDQQPSRAHKRNHIFAKKLGKFLGSNNNTVLFGFEGDHNSYPEIVARECVKAGGHAVAFTWCNSKKTPALFTIVNTGMERGAGREVILINSADMIIGIGGGSGTLLEIALAYQKKKPVFLHSKSGGISSKYANTFLDQRKNIQITGFTNLNELKHLITKNFVV